MVQNQIKIRLLKNKMKSTEDLIIKGAIAKRIKQLELRSRVDSLSGFYWNDKIHI